MLCLCCFLSVAAVALRPADSSGHAPTALATAHVVDGIDRGILVLGTDPAETTGQRCRPLWRNPKAKFGTFPWTIIPVATRIGTFALSIESGEGRSSANASKQTGCLSLCGPYKSCSRLR